MVFGGAPYYWSLLDKRFSFAQNLDRLYFSSSGELVPEFRRLFESVFRHPEPYLRLVTALGNAACGMTREELAETAKVVNTGKLTRWLRDLEQSGFVKMFVPFGKRKKGALYQLVDAFTLFHFRFTRAEGIGLPEAAGRAAKRSQGEAERIVRRRRVRRDEPPARSQERDLRSAIVPETPAGRDCRGESKSGQL